MFINMFGNKSLVILLFQGCYSAFTANNFIFEPDKEVYTDEGSDITLKWQFKVGSWFNYSPDMVIAIEFLFGTWEHPGYVNYTILIVSERNKVVKGSGFERKVDWHGNIYKCLECNAIVKMYNLTLADFKTYGVEIHPIKRNKMKPLKNWLTLIKSVPAKIIKWPPRIVVEVDNATAVECKATGRPTPSVAIIRNNLTLCNSTGQCVYEISAANKYVHEGEYLCLVQQRSPRNHCLQIKRSMSLTVLELTKIPEADTAGTTPTTAHTAPNTTTSSNETKTTPIADKEEHPSWNKQYLWFLVLIPVAISVVVVFLVYRRCSYDDNDQGNMHEMQNLHIQ